MQKPISIWRRIIIMKKRKIPYWSKKKTIRWSAVSFRKNQDQVKIYREGTICSYAPEFGKIEQIQVLSLAWEGDGSEHMTQIIFEREREKHHD